MGRKVKGKKKKSSRVKFQHGIKWATVKKMIAREKYGGKK